MGIAWLMCLKWIIENGDQILDEDVKLNEYISLVLDVNQPDQLDSITESFWALKFCDVQPKTKNIFDYMSRLNNYNGVNQIDVIRDRLLSKPETKSATVITLMPSSDIQRVPCLVSADFKIRGGKLITQSFFRSQDVWNKQPFNLLLLKNVASFLANDLNVRLGSIKLYIASAHIYESDLQEATTFIKANHKHGI